MNNFRNSLNTPQVSGKPKIILIAVFALFGFMVLIITHYIIKSYGKSSSVSNGSNVSNVSPNTREVRSTNNRVSNNQENSIPVQNIGSHSIADTGTLNSGSNRKQVFNIKKNIFSLDDTEAACGVFGAEVASIDQLIEAHKKGADWCNVGWTNDGIAAFPIQMDTWEKTQDNQGVRRNECGSYGINVARSDPHLLYGVNCYGVKPSPRGNEKIKHSYMSDKEREKLLKMDEFKKRIADIPIMPFNDNKWSSCGKL
jgi:hypothetical protein